MKRYYHDGDGVIREVVIKQNWFIRLIHYFLRKIRVKK
jgi:hypothetical protein